MNFLYDQENENKLKNEDKFKDYPDLKMKKRQQYHAKTISAKCYIYMGVEARELYLDEAHRALDTFQFLYFNSRSVRKGCDEEQDGMENKHN